MPNIYMVIEASVGILYGETGKLRDSHEPTGVPWHSGFSCNQQAWAAHQHEICTHAHDCYGDPYTSRFLN